MPYCRFLIAVLFLIFTHHTFAQKSKPRLVILADMGHDPDEEQQIVHLLICSNEFDLEGLIAVTGRFFRKNPTDTVKVLMPQLFHRLIDGYEKVYSNLQLHATGYKSSNYMRGIVASGQKGNGMKDVGEGRSSEGSRLITQALLKNDDRPLYIVVNSGANTLAQALLDFRANHTTEELKDFIGKIRVFDNGGQDESGAWICHEFPDIFYIRSNIQTCAFGGPANDNLGPNCWQPYPYSTEGQHGWVKEHIQTSHGSLGELYPDRYVGRLHYLEGGGSVPWLGLVTQGLSDISQPSWGGWSGRYSSEKTSNVLSAYSVVRPDEEEYLPFAAYSDIEGIEDRWVNPINNRLYEDEYTPVWRWRKAMWNDFKARMDWCVASYEKANHHPVAAINGDKTEKIHFMEVRAGKSITFDGSLSMDPDGDPLNYNWWVYSEAGTYKSELPIKNSDTAVPKIKIPVAAKGETIHIVFELSDENQITSLRDYRRIVLRVK